jgi:cell division protein FtsQ
VKQKNDHLKLANKGGNLPAWKKAIRFLFRLAFIIAILLLLKSGEAFFRISEIRVEGAGSIASAEIIAASGIIKGNSIFLLQEERVTEKVQKQYPRIKHLEISRNLPDTVVISVTERTPAAYIKASDGFWLIDQDTFCFAYTAAATTDYPILVGLADELIIPGYYLGCPVRREALADLFLAWSGGDELEIAEINLYDKYNLIVYTVAGLEIWLGDGKEMESKLNLIKQSIPYIKIKPGTHLDVRSEKRLVISKNDLIMEKEVDP